MYGGTGGSIQLMDTVRRWSSVGVPQRAMPGENCLMERRSRYNREGRLDSISCINPNPSSDSRRCL